VVKPKLIAALAAKTILRVAAGQNHLLALDDAGAVYSWGCGNYGARRSARSPRRAPAAVGEQAGCRGARQLASPPPPRAFPTASP